MKRKHILFFLIVGICFVLFAGCKSTEGSKEAENSEQIDGAVEDLLVIGEDKTTEYVLVRSDKTRDDAEAAMYLREAIKEKTGVDIKLTTDYQREASDAKEIVIGDNINEGTVYTVDREELGKSGFTIRVVGQRILLIGGSSEGTRAAVEYFLENYIAAEGASVVAGDENYVAAEEFTVKKFLIGGISVRDYIIVYNRYADAQIKTAASELQSYIQTATGAILEIYADEDIEPTGHEILLGKTNREDKGLVTVDRDGLGEEGFFISLQNGYLVITGGEEEDRGTLYGAYSFLEECVGWRFYSVDTELCHEAEMLNVPEGYTNRQVPVITYRDMEWKHSENALWSVKNKINGDIGGRRKLTEAYGGSERYVMNMHCHSIDIFAMIEEGTNPCFSDPAMMDTIHTNIVRAVKNDPEVSYLMIGLGDFAVSCTCAGCKELLWEEGSYMGGLIRVANRAYEELHEEYPDLKIIVAAYCEARDVPATKPAEGVYVEVMPFECCFIHDLGDEDCFCNREFVYDMEEWYQYTDNLWVWDYCMQNTEIGAFFPNFVTQWTNMQYYMQYGVSGMFLCGNFLSESIEFAELHAYLMAKLMWDPYMSYEEYNAIMDDFLQGYYGEGWESIRAYIDWFQELVSDGRHNRLWTQLVENSNQGSKLISAAEFNENYEKLLAWWDDAESKASGVQLNNVRRSRLQLDYMYLRLNFDLEYAKGGDAQKAIVAKNQAFYEALVEFNVTHIYGFKRFWSADIVPDFHKPITEWQA